MSTTKKHTSKYRALLTTTILAATTSVANVALGAEVQSMDGDYWQSNGIATGVRTDPMMGMSLSFLAEVSDPTADVDLADDDALIYQESQNGQIGASLKLKAIAVNADLSAKKLDIDSDKSFTVGSIQLVPGKKALGSIILAAGGAHGTQTTLTLTGQGYEFRHANAITALDAGNETVAANTYDGVETIVLTGGDTGAALKFDLIDNNNVLQFTPNIDIQTNSDATLLELAAGNKVELTGDITTSDLEKATLAEGAQLILGREYTKEISAIDLGENSILTIYGADQAKAKGLKFENNTKLQIYGVEFDAGADVDIDSQTGVLIEMRGNGSAALDPTTGGDHTTRKLLNGATFANKITNGQNATIHVYGSGNILVDKAAVGTVVMKDDSAELTFAVIDDDFASTITTENSGKGTITLKHGGNINLRKSIGASRASLNTLNFDVSNDKILTIEEAIYVQNLVQQANNNLAIEIKNGGRIENITTNTDEKLTSITALNNTNTITLVNIGEAGKNIPLVQAGNAGNAGKIKFDNANDGNKLYVEEIKVDNVANSSISFAGDFKLAAHINFRPALVAASAANGAFIMEGNFDWSNGAIATTNALNLQVQKDAILNLWGTKTTAAGTGATKVETAVTINNLTLANVANQVSIKLPDTALDKTAHKVSTITASNSDVQLTVDFGDSLRNKFALGEFKVNGNVADFAKLTIDTKEGLESEKRATLIFAADQHQIGAIEMASDKKYVHYQLNTSANANAAGVLVKTLAHDDQTNIIVDTTAGGTARLSGVVTEDGKKVKLEGNFNKLQFTGTNVATSKLALKNLDITFNQIESANANNGTISLSNVDLTVVSAANSSFGGLLIEDGISTIAGAGLKGRVVQIADSEKAILAFKEDIDVTITGAANGDNGGIVRFNNADALTVNNTVISANGANSIKEIQFTGGDVTFADEKLLVTADANASLVFNSEKDMTIVTGKGFQFSGKVKNLTDKKAVLEINEASVNTISNDIVSEQPLDLVYGKAVPELTITAKTIKGVNLLAKESGMNDLKLNRDGMILDKVGSADSAWKKLNVMDSATVSNGLFANEIAVAADKTLTVGGQVKSELGITLAGASNLSVLANTSLDSMVKAGAANAGIVNFQGNAKILKNLGTASKPLATVNLGNTGQHTLSANGYAQNISIGEKGLIVANKAELVAANLSLNSANIDLGMNELRLQGSKAANVKGKNQINVQFNKVENGAVKSGMMTLASSNVTLEKDAKFVILPIGSKDVTDVKNASLTILDFAGGSAGLLTKDNVEVDQSKTGLLSKWDVVIDSNKVMLLQSDNTAQLADQVKKDFAEQGLAMDDGSMVDVKDFLSAPAVEDLINKGFVDLPRDEALVKLTEVMQEVSAVPQAAEQATEISTAAVELASTAISSSVDNLSSMLVIPTVDGGSGPEVASGDEGGRAAGIWFAGNYVTGKQKAKKQVLGYKHDGMAMTIGVDVAPNASLVVGVAFTGAKNNVKPEVGKKSSKTTINSMLFSAYGLQQITDELYAQVIATVASNNVNGKSSRVSGSKSYDTIVSKYKNQGVSGNVTLGYKLMAGQQVMVVPMVGTRFGMVNGFDYTETGSTVAMNMVMTAQAKKSVEVMAGIRLMMNQFDGESTTVKPEVHAMALKNVARKAAKSQLMLGKVDMSTKAPKAVSMSYVAGGSLNIQSAGYEAGVGYDAVIAGKRLSHQGTLKLRVNF